MKIKDYEFVLGKNGFYEEFAGKIFLPSDYREREISDGEDYYTEKVLETTVKIAKKRLEIFGASIEKAEQEYEFARKVENTDGINNNKLCFYEYQLFIRYVVDNEYSSIESEDNLEYSSDQRLLIECDFCIEKQSESLWFYSILCAMDEDIIIKYQLTCIIENGWIEEEFYNNLITPKIIVLTEGKTDSEFIKKGINILYPHIKDYYHFMDFEASKYSAGASQLVNTVKSFIGSGINNLIIALFDNDTAGTKEISNLKKIRIPENIRILQYPDIELAKNYPMICPTGKQIIDVNGLSGSIEMYLGRDILKNVDGYIPIKRTGYDAKIKRYQGVVLDKGGIQARFRKKVKDLKDISINENDWIEMDILIKSIMNVWRF